MCRIPRKLSASGRTAASKVSLNENPLLNFAQLIFSELSPTRDSQEFAEWGPPSSASTRAQQETQITSDNERLLRTFHPNLAEAKVVYIASLLFTRNNVPYNEKFWVVSYDQAPGVTAGGLDIHILPAGYPMDMTIKAPTPQIEERLSILWRDVNPRKFLMEQDLAALRFLFPRAIGTQILISGRLRMLFKSPEDIIQTQKDGYLEEIGGLVVLLDKQTAKWPPDHNHPHPYKEADPTPKKKGMFSRAKGWMSRVKNTLVGKNKQKKAKDKDKGKAPANRISTTSDNSGRKLLSPGLESPRSPFTPPRFSPNSPRYPPYKGKMPSCESQDPDWIRYVPYPDEWPSYGRILSGAPIYATTRPDARNVEGKKLSQLTGYAKAVLLGTQYFWNRETHAQRASLMWWTAGVTAHLPELCLGGSNDDLAEFGVQQDYEIGLRMWESIDGESRMAPVKVANLRPRGGVMSAPGPCRYAF